MGEQVRDYRDLAVWRKGMELAKAVYLMTASFPKSEMYGLISQIRRAVVSIPSNIAEGQARHQTREFIQYLYIAKASLAEVDTQITLSHDLGYLKNNAFTEIEEKVREPQKMLFSLIRALESKA